MRSKHQYRPAAEGLFGPTEISQAELRRMKYSDRLQWASDSHGRLSDHGKLERIRSACKYARAWIGNVIDRPWQEVLRDAQRYCEEQAADRKAARETAARRWAKQAARASSRRDGR
jgi:hypothetical protein